MRRAVLLTAAVLVLAVTATASADPPRSGIVHVPLAPGMTPLEHGAQLYAANCAVCHGGTGEGISRPVAGASQSGLGPSLRGVGALAADFYLRTGYMPLSHPGAQPHRSTVLFDERELEALIAYVASLGPGPSVPTPHPDRGSLADGLRLFTDHCAGCHEVAAQGGVVTGAVAPALNPDSPVRIAEAVRVGPFLMPRFPRSQISDADLDSIIRYVDYAKHPDDRGGWAIGHVGPVPEGLVTWFVAMVALVGSCLLVGRRLRSRE